MELFEQAFSLMIFQLLTSNVISTVKAQSLGNVRVKTTKGILEGATINGTSETRQYHSFLGVQYAIVPGRFEMSAPIPAWEGIKMAIEYGPSCRDYENPNVENCLYLNIFSPSVNSSKKYPTVVYIHGGSFKANSNKYYGPNYFMNEDVVLVVIQYRLGIFGFLSTGDEVTPGNNGLKDQVMALQYIKENIEFFDGDKNRVTIMGQSAGSVSVTYHLISPMSQGLFHRAIAQSGTFLDPWALERNPKRYAKRLAKAVGCPISNSLEMINCLKSKPIENLIDPCIVRNITIKWHADPLAAFGPVIEPEGNQSSTFLSSSPYEVLKAGNFSSNISLLTGITKEKGVYLWSYYIMYMTSGEACLEANQSGIYPWLHDMQSKWTQIAPLTLYFDELIYNANARDNASLKIRDFYFGSNTIDHSQFYNLSHLYSDRLFVNSALKFISMYSKIGSVYPYLYTYNKNWGIEFGCRDDNDQKIEATHAAELDMLFSPLFGKTRKGKFQSHMSKSMTKLWASFANTGYPSQLYGKAKKFPRMPHGVKVKDIKFYELDLDTSIRENIYRERYEFWESLKLQDYDYNLGNKV